MMAATSENTVQVEKNPQKKPDKKKTKYDVIIIGAGPAGYTAGIYCARARHDTLILSGILPGGQLVNTTDVENYPGFAEAILGPDLMIVMRKQTEKMGATIIDDEAVDVDFRRKPFKVLTASEEYEAKAVIICTGADYRKLGLEGEKTFAGKGVSYCATCDGAFLTKFASTVHVVHRKDILRANKIMQERAMSNPKIKFHWNKEIEAISGNQKVQSVALKDTKTGEKTTLNVGGVFVAIGHVPSSKIFQNQIELDKNGYVVLKNNTETSVKGVFAAGDVHDHTYKQAVTAAGFGCMAAIDVDRYLTENS